jgi:O-methyltransferase
MIDGTLYAKMWMPWPEEQASARYAIVNLDCDLQEPMSAALAFFYPWLNEGGIMFFHDCGNSHWPSVKIAVDAFYQAHRIYPVRLTDKSGSTIVRKMSA